MKGAKGALPILYLLLVISGCEERKAKKVEYIAKVGDYVLMEEDLDIWTVPGFSWTKEDRRKLRDEWVKNTLFYLAARKEGLDKDPKIKKRLEWSERAILAQEYLKEKRDRLSISPEELKKTYEERHRLFEEEVELLLVFFQDTSKVEDITKILKKKHKDIGEIYTKFGKDSEINVINTDMLNLGVFVYGYRGVPERAKEAVKTLKEGEISDLLKTNSGFLILKLIQRRNVETSPEEVMDFIKEILVEEKREVLEDSLYTTLKNRYYVEIKEGY